MTKVLQLKVGDVYQNSDHSTRARYKIKRRWGPELFEGVVLSKEDGRETSQTYMFNSFGTAIGYPGNEGMGPFFRLEEAVDYEVSLIYKDGNFPKAWERLDKCSPWTEGTFYLVREKDKSDTLQLMNHNDFCEFVDDIFDTHY